ncbi:MAG TPA: 30S ribosomal protein S4 [Candidatus Korarchaeota archaeon]|nr:30S ribosomal protein S4 [Candidatus Korarchaeota archaeon]
MGDPKKSRKKWEGPSHPWRKEILAEELELLGRYGLRNKRELWIAKTILRRIRASARRLLALPPKIREREEKSLLNRLYKMGIVPSPDIPLDEVLNLTVESILERRLQTIVYKKGLAKSLYHARQLVVHGHISIGGVRVTSPSHLVSREEEELIGHAPTSPYYNRGEKE